MQDNQLTISVVIPAYNSAAHVSRAIDSVLAQTRPADEIIVVDDGSTDATADVIRAYGPKVRLITQPNGGVSAARNAGINAASGDWIAFLDADDEWLTNKIERQAELLKRNPQLMWTTGNYYECLSDPQRRAEHTPPSHCARLLKGKELFESYFQAVHCYLWGHTNCMLINKKIFSEVGVFQRELPVAEDIDLWLRIAYRYPSVGFSCEPLAIYHLSTENSLMKKQRDVAIYADFMDRHLKLAKQEGVLKNFYPAAGAIMRLWIRGMLFQGHRDGIRELLKRFPRAFSAGYCGLIYLLTVFPVLTVLVLRGFSKIIRTLKLRRRVTLPPQKSSK